VARKLYYNPKLLSFLEALDLYIERSRLTMLFQVTKMNYKAPGSMGGGGGGGS
jgi:hypothetical protein